MTSGCPGRTRRAASRGDDESHDRRDEHQGLARPMEPSNGRQLRVAAKEDVGKRHSEERGQSGHRASPASAAEHHITGNAHDEERQHRLPGQERETERAAASPIDRAASCYAEARSTAVESRSNRRRSRTRSD
jgi:hypothetical protein